MLTIDPNWWEMAGVEPCLCWGAMSPIQKISAKICKPKTFIKMLGNTAHVARPPWSLERKSYNPDFLYGLIFCCISWYPEVFWSHGLTWVSFVTTIGATMYISYRTEDDNMSMSNSYGNQETKWMIKIIFWIYGK